MRTSRSSRPSPAVARRPRGTSRTWPRLARLRGWVPGPRRKARPSHGLHLNGRGLLRDRDVHAGQLQALDDGVNLLALRLRHVGLVTEPGTEAVGEVVGEGIEERVEGGARVGHSEGLAPSTGGVQPAARRISSSTGGRAATSWRTISVSAAISASEGCRSPAWRFFVAFGPHSSGYRTARKARAIFGSSSAARRTQFTASSCGTFSCARYMRANVRYGSTAPGASPIRRYSSSWAGGMPAPSATASLNSPDLAPARSLVASSWVSSGPGARRDSELITPP